MEKDFYIAKIRPYLHDMNGKIWSDDELEKMLEDAAVEYSRDTGIYRGKFDFIVNDDGICRLPDDFISFVAAWNDEGTHIDPVSADELARAFGSFIVSRGTAEFVYEDTVSIGQYRLCPNPAEKQTSFTIYATDFGVMNYPGYGIPDHAPYFGTASVFSKYSFVGDAQYIREERYEKISDYIALVYNVLSQAFTVDSEFRNPDKAALYQRQYELRVGRIKQIQSVSAIRSKSLFY